MYYTKSAITHKLIRLTHVVLGTDEYFFPDSNKVIANNSIVNIYIVYKLSPKTISTDNALKNCLFGTIKADKPNTDPDKYIYSGYGIGFDQTGEFTHPEGNSPNFSVENKIFVLSLHYNGDNSYLFVNGRKVTQFKSKNSEIATNRMFLGTLGILNLSPKDINDIKLYRNVYYFSVDYNTISNENIIKIHKYLMKKNGLI